MAFYPNGGSAVTTAQVTAALVGATIPGSLTINPGTLAVGGLMTANSVAATFGSVDISSPSTGLKVAEGTNAKQGLATLSAGTVTVANTSVTANSRILVTCQILGTVTSASTFDTPRTAGTSFTIHASQATDTSTVAWEIFEPG